MNHHHAADEDGQRQPNQWHLKTPLPPVRQTKAHPQHAQNPCYASQDGQLAVIEPTNIYVGVVMEGEDGMFDLVKQKSEWGHFLLGGHLLNFCPGKAVTPEPGHKGL